MKNLFLVILLCLTAPPIFSQFKLDVTGDSRIQGKLELESEGGSVFIGKNAGNADNGNPHFNVFIGSQSGVLNNSGEQNILIGYGTGLSNLDGSYNTFIGSTAGTTNQSGSQNAFYGYSSGLSNLSGSSNTYIGVNSGALNATGSWNTALGYNANSNSQDYENSTAIGYNASPSGSNAIRLGNASITSISGHVAFTSDSDKRFKKNVQTNTVPGLAFINKLQPVTYSWDLSAYEKWGNTFYGVALTSEGKFTKEVEKMVFSGFLAQDVERVAEEIGYNFSGIDKPSKEEGLYGLRYATFVVPLVKAVQELQDLLETQDANLKSQAKELQQLRHEINALKDLLSVSTRNNQQENAPAKELISQIFNISPNPSSNRIALNLLTDQRKQAVVIVLNAEGKQMVYQKIAVGGNQTLDIDVSKYPSGMYTILLMEDGKIADSEPVIISKDNY